MKATIYLLTILLLIGCGTLEVGIEEATAVSPSIKATKTSTIAQSATKEPTRPAQAATVEPEPTPKSVPLTAVEMLVLSIQQELRGQNYDALEALMTEQFIVGWTIGELDHVTLLVKEKIQFTIAHKDVGDDTPLQTRALPPGELIDLPGAGIFSQTVPKRAVVDDRKVKAVLYDEVTVGNKVFAFRIDGVWPVYDVINIKPDVQIEIEDMMRSIIMTNEIAKDPPPTLLEGYGLILTYRDEDIGFEIDYPASWHVSDTLPEIKQKTGNNSVIFTSFKPSIGGGEGLPDGANKIDLRGYRKTL